MCAHEGCSPEDGLQPASRPKQQDQVFVPTGTQGFNLPPSGLPGDPGPDLTVFGHPGPENFFQKNFSSETPFKGSQMPGRLKNPKIAHFWPPNGPFLPAKVHFLGQK